MINLLTAARLAEAAYEDDPVFDGWTFEPLHDGETQVFGCENSDGVLAIAFRGSSSARDWITDATFATVKRDTPGRWHRGMSRAFDGVEGGIFYWICRRAPREVVLLGHSLGGGIATIASSHFNTDEASLITFGAPRVCTYRAAEWLKVRLLTSRAVRMVKYGDPVPRLPLPIGLQLGIYTHALPPTMLGVKGHDLAPDHPMAGYVADLIADTEERP